jgi:hypothetical protein
MLGWASHSAYTQPTGHPVIFIPGNAGSFKQVRSIASSASRQYYTEQGGIAEGMEDKSSLDFFAGEQIHRMTELSNSRLQ